MYLCQKNVTTNEIVGFGVLFFLIPKNCRMFYKFIDNSTKKIRETLLIIHHFSAKSITQL